MDVDFQYLLERFNALGGIADNVCQRVGEYGRGVFPIDSSRMVKIMTPKNLLVNADNLCLDGDHVVIKDGSGYTAEEVAFLELYWNDYSWGNSGNNDSASFLKFIVSLEEPIKKQLLASGFVGSQSSVSDLFEKRRSLMDQWSSFVLSQKSNVERIYA